MTKHAKKSNHLQAVDLPRMMAVEIPLPLIEAFDNIEKSFFELCIDAGQQVLSAMMEQDRENLCGPRWKRDPDRRAGRAGTTKSEVTLGGRRIPVSRPRVRSKEGEEVDLPSFAFASRRDPLDRHALNAVACGISTLSGEPGHPTGPASHPSSFEEKEIYAITSAPGRTSFLDRLHLEVQRIHVHFVPRRGRWLGDGGSDAVRLDPYRESM
jgi:hypothetical protein